MCDADLAKCLIQLLYELEKDFTSVQLTCVVTIEDMLRFIFRYVFKMIIIILLMNLFMIANNLFNVKIKKNVFEGSSKRQTSVRDKQPSRSSAQAIKKPRSISGHKGTCKCPDCLFHITKKKDKAIISYNKHCRYK